MGVTLRGADQIVDNTWTWRREYPEIRGRIADLIFNDGRVGLEVIWSETGEGVSRIGHPIAEYIHLMVSEGLITRVNAQPDRASWLRYSRGSAGQGLAASGRSLRPS